MGKNSGTLVPNDFRVVLVHALISPQSINSNIQYKGQIRFNYSDRTISIMTSEL